MKTKKSQKATSFRAHKPRTIKEAIDDLYQFFDCDIYSHFYPEVIEVPATKGGKPVKVQMCRKDLFKNEKEFRRYLKGHFDILQKQIKLIRKQNGALK